MQLRELGTGYPYGLSLMLQAIGAATHNENIKNMIDPSDLLDEMREKIKNPKYLGEKILQNFIENPHRVEFTAIPSKKSVEIEQNLEKNFLKKIQENLSEKEIAEIKENAKKLDENQKKPQNIDILPKIAMTDIPRKMKVVSGRDEISPARVHYNVATNNLLYLTKKFPLSGFTSTEFPMFSLYVSLIGELGFADKDYIEAQKIIASTMSFSSAWAMFSRYGEEKIRGFFTIGSRFLPRNKEKSLEIFDQIIEQTRFDETEHIRNLFDEKLLSLKTALTSSGNATAMRRASSGHTLAAHVIEQTSGVATLDFLKNFLKKSDAEMTEIFENFHKKSIQNSPFTLTIAKENFYEKNDSNTLSDELLLEENFESFQTQEAWLTDLAVGYCASSIKVVPAYHEDAVLFVLLGQFLRDGYLHTAIREQGGAYGSGANYDSVSQSFRFFSYRDPRIEGTFADFENAIKWLLETEHDEERLDEAKIGVIAKIDTPSSPAQEAMSDAMQYLKNYDKETQNAERQKILDASIDDLKRIAREYLSDFSKASRVVITGKQNREECEKLGLTIYELE